MAKRLPPHIRAFLESPKPRKANPDVVFELLKHYKNALAENVKTFRRKDPERARFLSPQQEARAAFYGAIKVFLLADGAKEVAMRFTSAIKGALQLASSAEMKRRKENSSRASARGDVWESAKPILEASKALRAEEEMSRKIRATKTLAGKQRKYAKAKFTLPSAPSKISMRLKEPPREYFEFPHFEGLIPGRTRQDVHQLVSVALEKIAVEGRKRRKADAVGIITEWPFTPGVLKSVHDYFNTSLAERTEGHPAFAHVMRAASPAAERVVDNFMQSKRIGRSFREKLLGATMLRVKAGILKASALDELERGVRYWAYTSVKYAFKKMQDEASGRPVRLRGRPRKT